jgi:A/G-specific adenine glycosylase
LPGVGAYTAAAIAAIAFGEQAAAVDTNVRRVVARLNGFREPSRAEIERMALEMIPPDRASDFTQAMMDLGATICRPRTPRCAECPLRTHCAAFRSGDPEAYPARTRRRERPHRHGVAYWIEREGHFWLVRRPASGMLGGMAALPGTEWIEVPPHDVNAIGVVRHVFTHFSLDLQVVPASEPVGEGWWHAVSDLGRAGLPTLYRRACELALGKRDSIRSAA